MARDLWPDNTMFICQQCGKSYCYGGVKRSKDLGCRNTMFCSEGCQRRHFQRTGRLRAAVDAEIALGKPELCNLIAVSVTEGVMTTNLQKVVDAKKLGELAALAQFLYEKDKTDPATEQIYRLAEELHATPVLAAHEFDPETDKAQPKPWPIRIDVQDISARVILGDGASLAPDLLIERRVNHWLVIAHPDDASDPIAGIEIFDDGRGRVWSGDDCKVQVRDGFPEFITGVP